MSGAWANQAASLVEVQKYGGSLEREVRNLLDWDSGRVVYDDKWGYTIQVDCAYPNLTNPAAIVSVTYSNPDTPGHSNENKLQLKLGELALLKCAHPDIRVVLVLGGTEEAWLSYVLKAFQFFFDDLIFLWNEDHAERLISYAQNPDLIPLKHTDFWINLTKDWNARALSPATRTPPCGLIRYAVLDQLKAEEISVRPSDIQSEIGRACMMAAQAVGGREWDNYLAQNWGAIEMSRSYFNPVEATTQLILNHEGYEYEGGLARDVEVRSFLHDLGMRQTKLSEDFILETEGSGRKVFIQCKASGGGRKQHGKNIQNRTKEQIARSILYRSTSIDGKTITYSDKSFIWIAIVDGDWGVTRREPLKYVHMLELAGYDYIIGASELLNDDLSVKYDGNPLVDLLKNLGCKRVGD